MWFLPALQQPEKATLYKSTVANERVALSFSAMSPRKVWFYPVAE